MADQKTSEVPRAGGAVPNDLDVSLAIALDVDDLVQALRLARAVHPWFRVAKIGLELYSAVGPDAITAMQDLGFDVFADLKLHDIPTTVGRASRVMGALGVSYLSMHAHGGAAMLRAGAEGLEEGAVAAEVEPGVAVAITVLTSDNSAPDHIVPRRAALAAEAGCGALVCAAGDLTEVRQLTPRLERIVPGIRPAGADRDDQVRAVTPAEAAAAGAQLLVIGRPVTRADDPAAAAQSIAEQLAG